MGRAVAGGALGAAPSSDAPLVGLEREIAHLERGVAVPAMAVAVAGTPMLATAAGGGRRWTKDRRRERCRHAHGRLPAEPPGGPPAETGPAMPGIVPPRSSADVQRG